MFSNIRPMDPKSEQMKYTHYPLPKCSVNVAGSLHSLHLMLIFLQRCTQLAFSKMCPETSSVFIRLSTDTREADAFMDTLHVVYSSYMVHEYAITFWTWIGTLRPDTWTRPLSLGRHSCIKSINLRITSTTMTIWKQQKQGFKFTSTLSTKLRCQ